MDQVTKMGASEIAGIIRRGKMTAADVVEAHIQRIEAVNDCINAVIVPLYDEARAAAKAADEKRGATPPDQLPPLFGVPVTIKDQYFVKGTPVSCGLAHRSEEAFDNEGTLVSRLREAGAIILGKTNLPQLLISHECLHAKYGNGRNPFDTERVPGGSSGGEAAIIAAGGSPLGLGGDMGGSIRIPSHFCGISGLKPTGGRLPNDDSPFLTGHVADLLGFEGIVVQPGPMARRVDDLKLAMDCFAGKPAPAHTLTAPVSWKAGPVGDVDGIRIGVYEDDGYFTASPAIRRLVRESSTALTDNGNPVSPFGVPDAQYAARLYLSLLSADGGKWILESLAGEQPISDVKGILRAGSIPGWLRRILSSLMKTLGQEHTVRLLSGTGRCSAADYWNLTAQRTKYQGRFIEAMEQAEVDVLICPPHGLPAFPLDSNRNGLGPATAIYPAIYNLVGLPAGVVAAGRVREGEESDRTASKDKVIQDAIAVEKGSAGLPLGVQVVGRHWREDQVLSVMKFLETHFRGSADYPVNACPI